MFRPQPNALKTKISILVTYYVEINNEKFGNYNRHAISPCSNRKDFEISLATIERIKQYVDDKIMDKFENHYPKGTAFIQIEIGGKLKGNDVSEIFSSVKDYIRFINTHILDDKKTEQENYGYRSGSW